MKRSSRSLSRYRVAKMTAGLMLALATFALSGCPPPGSGRPRADRQLPEDLFHTVSFKGETLGLIASWYTGSTENWQAIVESNPGIEVTRIRIGDTIRIPGALVVERNPLPQRAVSAANKAPSAPPKRESAPERKPDQSGEPKDIAPRGDLSAKGDEAPGVGRDEAPATGSRMEEIDDFMEDANPSGANLHEGESPVPPTSKTPVEERSLSEAERIRQEAIRQAESGRDIAPRNEVPAPEDLSDVPFGADPVVSPAPPAAPTPVARRNDGVKTRDELLEELLN